MNRERAASENKDIQLLSRMFRLARVRWGLTTFNPCDGIEYLPESPRDQYVSDDRYAEIYNAASPVLQCMLEISTQTGAREGMIFDIRIGDFNEAQIELRVTKKRNDKGYITKAYSMTPDLRAALVRALELRKKNRGTRQAMAHSRHSGPRCARSARITARLPSASGSARCKRGRDEAWQQGLSGNPWNR
jgi:integrase